MFIIITVFSIVFLSAPVCAQLTTPSPLPLPSQISTDEYNDSGHVGYCMNHIGSNVCTANDFTITALQTVNIDDGCSSLDDYMQIDLQVTFTKTQPARYEVGAWFYRGAAAGTNFNSQSALSGDFCTRVGVDAGLSIPGTATLTADTDGDGCVDVDDGSSPGNLGNQVLNNLVLPCRDVVTIDTNTGAVTAQAPDGTSDLSACTTWANNQGQVCSNDQYRSFVFPHAAEEADELLPGTKSKCNCGEFDGGPIIVSIPDMAITKSCSPTTLVPGATTTCTITLTNSGLGTLIGSGMSGGAGFFYEDDYPESQGSIDPTSITATAAPASAGNSHIDGFILNADGSNSSNHSLNIFPGDIGPSETYTIVYDFITVGDNTLPNTDPINVITNTVCTAHANFDSGQPDVIFTYPNDPGSGNCATATITTPVNISSFKANVSKLTQGYDFSWSTTTETGNLGFNIYALLGETRFKLNHDLIPTSVVNSMSVQEYSYQLNSQFNGLVDKFIIEDVDVLGRRHSHGIYKLGKQFGVSDIQSMQKDTDWTAINTEFDAVKLQTNKQIAQNFNKQINSNQKSSKQSNATKILMETAEAGIYKVSYADLIDLGLDLSNVSFDSISIKSGDVLIPIDVHKAQNNQGFSAGSYIQFYAQAVDTLYTDKNIYTLSLNSDTPSPSMAITPAAPHGNQFNTSYAKTVKLNRNQIYSFASPIANEPWFDSRLLAVHAPLTSYFNIDARDMIADDAQLSFVYWGGLDFPDDKLDHDIDFKFNGATLGSDKFDGIKLRNKTFDISSNLLKDSNEIELVLSADTINKIDLVNLESIALTYRARLYANHDKISFQQDEGNVMVAGFVKPDVSVFALHEDSIVKLKNYKVKREVNYTYNVYFSGISGLNDYIVVANNAVQTPGLRLSQAKNISQTVTENLIISHTNFIGRELTNYAKSTRDDYRIVDVQDIYNLYSGNKPDGEAIKSFISDVSQNGNLKSVLLVGGDTYDYKDYTGLGSISFVPTIYRATDDIIKFSAVDALYGDTDNDNIPDVQVGRLPVRTLKELKTIIYKSDVYKNQNSDLNAVLAADDSESLSSYHFTTSSNQLASQLESDNWSISTAYLDEKSISETREEIISAMNDGVRLAVYTGHSSSRRWGFEGLFKNTDVAGLYNVDKPFGVVQWGCWNTYFVDPKEDSLGHEFMLSGNKGAAFVLGASTLTDADQESYFSHIFNAKLLTDGESIGSAMLKSKQAYAASSNVLHKDILWGVTILGDPLLKIK